MTSHHKKFSNSHINKRLIIIGWCSRYVHVIADTGIIFGAFYALEQKEGEEVCMTSKDGGERRATIIPPTEWSPEKENIPLTLSPFVGTSHRLLACCNLTSRHMLEDAQHLSPAHCARCSIAQCYNNSPIPC